MRQAFLGSLVCLVSVSSVAYFVEPQFFQSLPAQRLYISILIVWLCAHIAYCFFFKMTMKQEELLRSQANFLRMVNHELRTPLASLMSATHLLKQRQIPAGIREEVEQIHLIAQQMTTLISGVLDLSRADNHLAVQKGKLSLGDLLQHIASLYKAMADNKGLPIRVQVQEQVPEVVEADKVRLIQILSNLLSNAIKYSDQGVITINLSASVNESNVARLQFSVTDEGQGLSEQQQAGLFKPYSRFHDQHAESSSGLGLSIVKELVALLNGQVGVESKLGSGSTFWFEIEAKVASNTFVEPVLTEVGQSTQLSGFHLLVVDDDRMLLKLTCKLLSLRGAECTPANSAKAALTALQNSSFDLILTDFHMPDLNGGDLTSMIRMISQYKKTPILALSGGILEEDLEFAKRSGIDEILSKPLNSELLYSKVSSYLLAAKESA